MCGTSIQAGTGQAPLAASLIPTPAPAGGLNLPSSLISTAIRSSVPPSPRSNRREIPAFSAITAPASPTLELAPRSRQSPSWVRPPARVPPAPPGRCWQLKRWKLETRSSGVTTPLAKCTCGRSIPTGPGQALTQAWLIPAPAPALISWLGLGLPPYRFLRQAIVQRTLHRYVGLAELRLLVLGAPPGRCACKPILRLETKEWLNQVVR